MNHATTFSSKKVETRLGQISYSERSGSGDPLMLLHGVGGNAGAWVKQCNAFREHRLIAWDAPGYGESFNFDASTPSLEDYAAAVIALLDALGIGSADVLGHSFGGLVAARTAALYPTRVSRLLLTACSSGHATYPHEKRESLLRARLVAFTGEDPKSYARTRVANLLSETPEDAVFEEAVEIMSRLKVPGFHQANRMISGADIFTSLPDIAAPTRVICGTADRVTPLELNAKIAASVSEARLVAIENAGHWLFLEFFREFNQAVEEFLYS